MTIIKTIVILFLAFYSPQLYAQSTANAQQMQVIKTFNSFFEAVKARDTVEIKKNLLYPYGTNQVFHQSGFNESGELWASQMTLQGFLQTLSSQEGNLQHCNKNFEDVSIEMFDRYAIVSAKYKCFNSDSQLDNCGKYTLRFIKNQQWKIEQVYRYAIKDNCSQLGLK
jgi:hypothetical protein